MPAWLCKRSARAVPADAMSVHNEDNMLLACMVPLMSGAGPTVLKAGPRLPCVGNPVLWSVLATLQTAKNVHAL